jgi:pimeloyl-ACP methyl ester carboxylesterase
MKIALEAALVLVIILFAVVFYGQRRLLYAAPHPAQPPGPELGELIQLPSTVAAWLPPARSDGAVIIHFHGNGEQLGILQPIVSALRAQGLGVLAVEYPGYGLAPGSPSERSLTSAAAEARDFALDRLRVPAGRLVIEGQSLGTAVAAQLAARGRVQKLVLISPMTSVSDLVARFFPFPARYVVRDRFDTRAIAPSIRMPVLIIHGRDDDVVPFAMGEELERLFPEARLIAIEGAGHNDLWARHAPTLASAIARFAMHQ